jgi:hypothetical protein
MIKKIFVEKFGGKMAKKLAQIKGNFVETVIII